MNGNKFIDNLAQDIKTEFPETTGFSVRNLKYMKKFAKLFVEDEIDENNFAAITKNGSVELLTLKDLKDKLLIYGNDYDAFIKATGKHYVEVQLWTDRYITKEYLIM